MQIIHFFSNFRSVVPEHAVGLVVILHFLLAVLIHGRQVEWTTRLDFLWNLQVSLFLSISYFSVSYENPFLYFKIIIL